MSQRATATFRPGNRIRAALASPRRPRLLYRHGVHVSHRRHAPCVRVSATEPAPERCTKRYAHLDLGRRHVPSLALCALHSEPGSVRLGHTA